MGATLARELDQIVGETPSMHPEVRPAAPSLVLVQDHQVAAVAASKGSAAEGGGGAASQPFRLHFYPPIS